MAHAWKVCKLQKGFMGSNPILSAFARHSSFFWNEGELLSFTKSIIFFKNASADEIRKKKITSLAIVPFSGTKASFSFLSKIFANFNHAFTKNVR